MITRVMGDRSGERQEIVCDITGCFMLITDPCPGHTALNVAITELVRYRSPS